MSLPPACIASPIADVETPALLIDLDAYERNLDRMVDSLRGRPVRLRAHAKTHKCPIIAGHQVARGALGICCQTLGEAEAMVLGGVRNILITNQVVSPGKIRRLAALAKQAEVMVCADDEANLHDLDAAAGRFGVRRWRVPSRPVRTSASPDSRRTTARPSTSTTPPGGPRS
jgi:3-hydroxy-D-aspartate aldolase